MYTQIIGEVLKQLESSHGGSLNNCDGIMVISVIVPMLTNYLGIPLIYLTAAGLFPESEGVYVNVNLRIL